MDNFLVEVVAQGHPADFQVQGTASPADWNAMYPHLEYVFGDFTERLWAYLTIQQLLQKSDSSSEQEKANATAKALEMSLQYSFVTPLTSMVVTKPEAEDGSDAPLIADKLTEAQRQAAERKRGCNPPAATNTRKTQRIGNLIVPGLRHRIKSSSSSPSRGASDGFLVNGQIIGKKKVAPDGNINTYFGRFGVGHQKLGVTIEVSTQDISVFYSGQQVKLLWSDTGSIKTANLDLRLTDNCSLTVTLRHSVKFMVIKHTKVWKRRHDQQDYLGFYTLDSRHLSASVHGLLGQFYNGVEFEVDIHNNVDAVMYVKGQTLSITRHVQKDFSKDVKNGQSTPCWFVSSDGAGLIDGAASDYIRSGLFKTA